MQLDGELHETLSSSPPRAAIATGGRRETHAVACAPNKRVLGAGRRAVGVRGGAAGIDAAMLMLAKSASATTSGSERLTAPALTPASSRGALGQQNAWRPRPTT